MVDMAHFEEEAESPRVLVAEGSIERGERLATALERSGYRTTVVTRGDVAYEVVRRVPLDLYVLEVDLPGLGALEILRLARRQVGFRPAIITCRMATKDLFIEALGARAFAMLSEPVDPRLLTRAVDRAIEKFLRGGFRG